MKEFKNTTLIIAIICIMTLINFSCGESPDVADEEKRFCIPEELRADIETYALVYTDIEKELGLTGKVSYNPEQFYQYVPLLDGIARQVLFNLGDQVRKGQVLLEIQSPEITGLQAELNTARSGLKIAERKLLSVKELYTAGIASEKDYLEATNDVHIIQSEILRINQTLDTYGGSLENGILVVRAPFSGYIVDKNIVSGKQVHAGADKLFILSDLSTVWVMVNIYPRHLSDIEEGMSVNIHSTAYPGKVFEGSIERLSHVFDQEERVLKARVVMENRELLLKPGMFVSVNMLKTTGEKGYRIPADAVIFDNQQYHLVIIHDVCDLEVRRFQPVARTAGAFYLHEGVNEGELLLTRNHLLVYQELTY